MLYSRVAFPVLRSKAENVENLSGRFRIPCWSLMAFPRSMGLRSQTLDFFSPSSFPVPDPPPPPSPVKMEEPFIPRMYARLARFMDGRISRGITGSMV